MAIAQYKILDVTDDGFVTVKWASDDGPAVTYPVPLDEEGDPLAGSDLENWLAGRWKSEIKDRVERTKSFDTVRASKRAGFRNIQAKVDALDPPPEEV